ncbi:MAG: hypothetical protein Q9207_002489 [Kuettlingeria erythrocarpa]
MQLYYVSEPVLYYVTLILLAISILAAAGTLWILSRYALGQNARRFSNVDAGRGKGSTDLPARNGDPTVTVSDVNQGVFSPLNAQRQPGPINADHINTDPPNPNHNQTTEAPTRDPRTDALLAKEQTGAALTHSETRDRRRLEVPGRLQNTTRKYCRETVLLKKADGHKLTKGERKFLNRTRPQSGDASESAVSESGISAVVGGITIDVPSTEQRNDK